MNLFKQPEYIHILLNHFPLTGLAAALLALLTAVVCRNRVAMRIGLGLVGLMAFSAWPVSEYGEKGYDRVYAMSDEEGQASLKEHAELAKRWVGLYYAVAAIAGLGLEFSWKWPKSLLPVGVAVILLSGLCLTKGFQIASEGGEIRHKEFRQ